jgi:hypothetical protein
VTPYFRKASASILGDIVWTGGPNTEDSNTGTLSKIAERSISLRLSHVCQGSDVDGTIGGNPALIIELHAPDAKSSILFRCPDESTASQWLNAICAVVSSLTQRAVADVNSLFQGSEISNGGVSPNNNSTNEVCQLGEVKHLGWLGEQVSRAPCIEI